MKPIHDLFDSAYSVLIDWYGELTEPNRASVINTCADGGGLKVELSINPEPFDRVRVIEIVLYGPDNSRRVISRAEFEMKQLN